MNYFKNIIRSFRQKILQRKLSTLAKRLIIRNNRTLIIAPHPDDETFGCAGLITQKIESGSKVFILFLTNGEKSLPLIEEAKVKLMRRKSAIQALEILGIKENAVYWMDMPDGSIPRLTTVEFFSAKDTLLKIINKLRIEEVYTTHYLDGWSDHIAAYELAIEALKESENNVDFYLYWVWAWYYLGMKEILSLSWNKFFLLSIQPSFKKKKKALNVYYDAKTSSGEPYMGYLPTIFLKAFEWPFEVYEKVECK